MANPSYALGPILSPSGGWKKYASLGGVYIAANSGGWSQSNSYQTSDYAMNRVSGNQQQTLHSRGVSEISWDLGGDLLYGAQSLLNFFSGESRGLVTYVTMQQSPAAYQLTNCYVESFSMSGNADGVVQVNVSGKALAPPLPDLNVAVKTGADLLAPGWASGAPYVRDWTLTHSTPLQAKWRNTESPYPSYYRVGDSSIQLQVTTEFVLSTPTSIDVVIGEVFFITGLVQNRVFALGGRLDTYTYQATITNIQCTADILGNLVQENSTEVLNWGKGIPPIPGLPNTPVNPGQPAIPGLPDSPGLPATTVTYHPVASDTFLAPVQLNPSVGLPPLDAWPSLG